MQLINVIMAGLLITAPACSGPSYKIAAAKQPAQQWQFQRLMASQHDEGVRVHGRLTASRPYGLPKGYIDIAAYSPDGELLAATTASHVPSLLTYRTKRHGGVYFTADLAEKLPPGSIVKVALHHEQPPTWLRLPRNGNIVR